jgi:hypothetical protein
MVTLQRRWFVPSEKFEEFRRPWDQDILPRLIRQPGFVRGELYESDVRGHWLTANLVGMDWALPNSPGHYVDISSAIAGPLLSSVGYLSRKFARR